MKPDKLSMQSKFICLARRNWDFLQNKTKHTETWITVLGLFVGPVALITLYKQKYVDAPEMINNHNQHDSISGVHILLVHLKC